MDKQNIKYPESPKAHEIGDRALSIFNYKKPRSWVSAEESKRDYGWDLLVTLKRNNQVREDFFVQLKGSESPNYIYEGKIVSQELKVTTINWLLEKKHPVMICLCETNETTDDFACYAWLHEEIQRIEKENPNWRKQEEVKIHIPRSQVIDKKTQETIDKYVIDFHKNMEIDSALGSIFAPILGYEKSGSLTALTGPIDRTMFEKVKSTFADHGIFEFQEDGDKIDINTLTTEDQERFKEIKKCSTAINEFRLKKAESILDELTPEITQASNYIKARYYNNKGAIFFYSDNLPEALNWFQMAEKLDPHTPKYVTNSLLAEYLLLTQSSEEGPINFSDSWKDRLDVVLIKNNDNAEALFLKATWTGETKGAGEAEEYLRKTDLWKKKPVRCRCQLAENYLFEGQWDKAVELLTEVKKPENQLDGQYWSILGKSFFSKALGRKMRGKKSYLPLPGPSEIQISVLKEAEKSFLKACENYASIGFPIFSDSTIVNLAVTQRILGNPEDAIFYCKSFLKENPKNIGVLDTLASCLIATNDYEGAVEYSRKVHLANPQDKRAYQNYILCLCALEDYGAILELTNALLTSGKTDIEDKAFSLGFKAIALNGIGKYGESIELIRNMKDEEELAEEGNVSEIIILKNNNEPGETIKAICRHALKSFPENDILLSILSRELNTSLSTEAVEFIEIIGKIRKKRQLFPFEIYKLGLCYITSKEYDKSLNIFQQGGNRYPHDNSFLYGQSLVYFKTGDQENSYLALQKYLFHSKSDLNSLKNLAYYSLETERIREAIDVFQKLAVKATNNDEKAQIHAQLWVLKKEARYNPKDILFHVIQFGKSIEEDPRAEAQLFMMFLLSPKIEEADSEIDEWKTEIGLKLKTFTEKKPNYPYFRSYEIPKDIPEEEKAKDIRAQLIALQLPHRFTTIPLRINSRSVPYPLVSRSQIYRERTIYDYWKRCISSIAFSDGIHIHFDCNNLNEEIKLPLKRNEICMDITSLLVLNELGLLDLVTKHFSLIYLANQTKRTIRRHYFNFDAPHPIAQHLSDWIKTNRSIIRVKAITRREDYKEKEDYVQSDGGVLIRDERSIDEILGNGVGESILLAKEQNVPLYTDEAIVRYEAQANYQVNCFSTISLIKALRKEQKLTLQEETSIFCEMIRKNFRLVPFDNEHLNYFLDEIIRNSRIEGNIVREYDLLGHKDMGTLLKQFADTIYKESWISQMAVLWWLSLMKINDLDNEIIVKCMKYTSYILSMRTVSGVSTGIIKDEQESKLGHLYAYFLNKCYDIADKPFARAWSIVKSSCQKIFYSDVTKYEVTLFKFIPYWVIKELSEETLSYDDKLTRLASISAYLPEEDRVKLDEKFMAFMKK